MSSERWELWKIHGELAQTDLASGPWAELGISDSAYCRGAAALLVSALVELSGHEVSGPADLFPAAEAGAGLLRAGVVTCSQFEASVRAVVESLEQRLRAAGVDPATC